MRFPYAIPRALGRFMETLGRPRAAIPQQRQRSNPGSVVDCAVYLDGRRQPGRFHFADAARAARRHGNAFVWLGLHEPDEATMTAVAEVFGLHELTAAQATRDGHRPGAETLGEVTRLVLRTARYVEHAELTADSEVVDTGDVTVLTGPGFVVTVRHGSAGALRSVRRDLEARPQLLEQGPWSVAYAVCDRMVDLYLEVAAHVEHDLERVEEAAFAEDRRLDMARIYQLKRELVEFKRAVLPLQEPLHRVLVPGVVPAPLHPYLVDVRGRLARAVERVGSFDDLLNSILQARLAQVSVDQNNDMRKIASWAAIAAAQTAIAGVYGMNFASMPGLDWRYGYFAVLGAMALAAVLLHRRFKRVGWL